MAVAPGALYDYCNKPDSRLAGGRSDRSPTGPAGTDSGGAGGIPGGGAKRKLGDVYDAVRRGASWDSLVNDFPLLYATKEPEMRKLYERFGGGKLRTVDGGEQPECIIIWGPPGTGKSTFAKSLFRDRALSYFRMTIGKWADGYAYEQGLFFDDMEPNLVPRAQLLLLMETGSVRWEVKGSTTAINVKMIVITSNYDPITWFPRFEKDEEKMRERGLAVVRRAEVYRYDPTVNGSWIRSSGNTIPEDQVKQLQDTQATLMSLWRTKSAPPASAAAASSSSAGALSSSSSSSSAPPMVSNPLIAPPVPHGISRPGYEKAYRAAMDRLEKEAKDPSIPPRFVPFRNILVEEFADIDNN